MSPRPRRALASAALLGLLLTACSTPIASPASPSATSSPTPAPTDTPLPTPSPSSTPTPTPSAAPTSPGSVPVIVTFRVAGEEEYRVRLTDARDIEIARRLLAGDEAPRIPNGVVRQGDGGVNAPWSWHIDPEGFEFADVTIELCDGRPSDVERGAISGDRFCPWSAQVVDVEEAA